MAYTRGVKQRRKTYDDLEESHEIAERMDIPVQNEILEYNEMKSVFEDEDEEDGFDFGDDKPNEQAEEEVL